MHVFLSHQCFSPSPFNININKFFSNLVHVSVSVCTCAHVTHSVRPQLRAAHLLACAFLSHWNVGSWSTEIST